MVNILIKGQKIRDRHREIQRESHEKMKIKIGVTSIRQGTPRIVEVTRS